MAATKRSSLHISTELEIRSAIADFQAVLKSGPRHPNVWGFFSNKNRHLLTLLGDVTFIQAVLLEGDPTVSSYVIAQPPSSNTEHYKSGRDLLVEKTDGTLQWFFCGRYDNLVRSPSKTLIARIEETQIHAIKNGAEFYIRTEVDFASRMVEFRNWLTLCSAMTRCRDFSIERESSQLFQHLQQNQAVSVRTLMDAENCDPSLMLGAIGKAITRGYAYCELTQTSFDAESKIFSLPYHEHQVSINKTPQREAIPKVYADFVPNNRRTACVPEIWRDMTKWPTPQASMVRDQDAYLNNKRAIEMYIFNRDFPAIQLETGLKRGWVRQLFKKCLEVHSDGEIIGFRALVRYSAENRAAYHRHIPAPPSNRYEGSTGGYAGTLVQLFDRFPDELLKIVESNVLKLKTSFDHGSKIHDQRITWKDLQSDVLEFLRKNKVGEDEYPFNTRDKCYSSLANFGRSILFKKPIRFIASRFGQAAADLVHIGKGFSSLIQATGPFQVVELDFHKHDSAAIVDVATPSGYMFPCNVPRFWIGCVVDTYNRAIIGSSDSFEAQTTESCVLDLIDSAIAPLDPSKSLQDFKGCEDGRWLPNQLLPTYEFHGWDILRLDRALAHQGQNTLTGLIATTGCAVCFSKPRTWWARSIVERTFSELTRRGAQRLLTTYGTGPADSRRQNPDLMAMKLHFTQSEMCDLAKSVIREINDTGREGVFWESSLNSLRRIALMPSFFARTLPIKRRDDRPTQWVRYATKVEANPVKGISPSIRVLRCRFTGGQLASAWHLVGQIVVLEINRHDIRTARVINAQNGTLIGNVSPERKWCLHKISWRNFQMIQKFGRYSADATRPEDPVRDFQEKKGLALEEAAKQRKSQNRKKVAQQLENIARDSESEGPEKHQFESQLKSGETLVGAQTGEVSKLQESLMLSEPPNIKSFSRR